MKANDVITVCDVLLLRCEALTIVGPS